MRNIFDKNFLSIGDTPIISLDRISKGLNGKIFGKIEGRNPAFSIKDRIGYWMIKDALDKGYLKEGMEILEPTSGNTGIALAMVGAVSGIKVNLVMPESMSIERRSLMKMFGANLILTPSQYGVKGSVDKAEEMGKESPELFYMTRQFENPANPMIHEATTGPEIYRDMGGDIDYFVAGVGTGGTITGTGRYLKRILSKPLKTVAVEPANSPVITKFLKNEPFSPAPHKIQGIGAGFIPKNLDLNIVDEVMTIEDGEALEFAKMLFTKEGIMAGISSGAALCAAHKIASYPESKDKNILFIVCDTGERYLSTDLFK